MAKGTHIVCHHEVRLSAEETEGRSGGWQLCFQWCTYNIEGGETLDGYRFIWRKPNGSLHAAMGQARLPSAKNIVDLLQRAAAHGWLGSVERKQSPPTDSSGPQPSNILDGSLPNLPPEIAETIVRSANVRIERIISNGQNSPEGFWYDQETHEWVLLISGAATLQFEGEPAHSMVAGSYINIPAHKKHRVEWTDPKQPTIWLAIHYSDAPTQSPP